MSTGRHDSDPLLAPLLAGDPNRRDYDRVIEQILSRHAEPLIDDSLNRAVRERELSPLAAEDLRGDILGRLALRLARLHEGDGEPIDDFAEYVRATVRNGVEDALKAQDPLRHALYVRVRYLLTHTNGLAVWGRSPLVCGLERWRSRRVVPVATVAALSTTAVEGSRRLRKVVQDVLERSEGPVLLSSLVDALVTASGLSLDRFVSPSALARQGTTHDPLARLEDRERLQSLWQELAALPVRQRRAMLLQLRLDDGESVPRVLASIGLVPMTEMAQAMAMSTVELLELWDELPLADSRIAALLEVTPQQVVNLRKAARDRLARRTGRAR